MKTRTLKRRDIDLAPYKIWNVYVDILANEEYRDLAPEQRPAQLVFWYESEVQNGGHLQYFENRGSEYLRETVAALVALGAAGQSQVLTEAASIWQSSERSRIETSEEFCEQSLEDKFSRSDKQFHECAPSLQSCREEHLMHYQSNFVLIE